MKPALLIAVLALAACGADGPPEPPSKATATPGLTISGEARIGIIKD